MGDGPKRTLSFFQLRHRLGAKTRPVSQDWGAWAEQRSALPAEANVLDGLHFEHMRERTVPVLCIHKRLNSALMIRLDPDTGSREDVEPSDAEVARLMQSTVVVFLGSQYVGIARGQLGGVQQGALVRYLDDRLPQADGWQWYADPVMKADDRARLAQATGVTRVEAHFHTEPMLTAPPSGRGIGSAMATMAGHMNAELDVSIVVKPRGEKRRASKALKDFVMADIQRFTEAAVNGSTPKVVAQFEDDEDHKLYLTSHPLASTVDVHGHDERFSTLVAAVVDEALAQRSNFGS